MRVRKFEANRGHEEGGRISLDIAVLVQVQGSEGQDKGGGYKNGKGRM